MGAFLGIASTTFGAIFLVLGVLALFLKPVKESFGVIPFGNPKLWTVIFIVAGLALGGVGVVAGAFSGGVSTASLTGPTATTGTIATSLVSCQMNAPTVVGGVANGNVTFRSDPNTLKHYYADVPFADGAISLNGTMFCTSDRADISKGESYDCYAKADSFRSQTSTTDSNTYYIVATSTAASQVAGVPWQQTIYLADSGNSNTAATTSSPAERTSLTFAQDEKTQYLGYYATLPGATVFGYLNNQTSENINFLCNNNQVGQLTITKTTATA